MSSLHQINNAGILFPGWDASSLEATLLTNLDGPVQLSRAMASTGPGLGLVVMVASEFGQLNRQDPVYAEALAKASSVEDVRKVVEFRESAIQVRW